MSGWRPSDPWSLTLVSVFPESPPSATAGAKAPRMSGLLMHVSSLPSLYGIGDLGPGAYRFAGFLSRTGQSLWQVLPLNPTEEGAGNSPYQSASVFAGNPLFVSPDLLVRDGFLEARDVASPPAFPEGEVKYADVIPFKRGLLEKAFESFLKRGGDEAFDIFCRREGSWLEDYALFQALKDRYSSGDWSRWPEVLRRREEAALELFREEQAAEISRVKFYQFLFFRQWEALRKFCGELGVRLFGDLPIYPTYESADLWAHPDLFKLDAEGRPRVVAGVPPDYFSSTGQLWGNPVYDWEAHRASGFRWWRERLVRGLGLYEYLRIDHFRGLVACWEVPVDEKTSVNGQWAPIPSGELFAAALEGLPRSAFIAEDLGTITPDVIEMRKRLGFPGMKVLIFAFGDDLEDHPYRPHTYGEDCVAYTGTHDNNTVRGWFEQEAGRLERRRLFSYLGRNVRADEVAGELLRLVLNSAAGMALFPLQDLLGLGAEGRMNRPSVARGNWQWRERPGQTTPAIENRLRVMTEESGRVPP